MNSTIKKVPRIKICDLSSDLIKSTFTIQSKEIQIESQSIESKSHKHLAYSSLHDKPEYEKIQSKSFLYDKNKRCFSSGKTLIVRYYHPKSNSHKQPFSYDIPEVNYSTFRLYDPKKKELIQCSEDIKNSTLLLYTNYSPFQIEGIAYEDKERFTIFEYLLKNFVGYFDFYQEEKDRHEKQKDDHQYTLLELPQIFKDLSKGNTPFIRGIISKGYNHIENEFFIEDQPRYYHLHKFINNHYINNEEVDKSIRIAVKFSIYTSCTKKVENIEMKDVVNTETEIETSIENLYEESKKESIENDVLVNNSSDQEGQEGQEAQEAQQDVLFDELSEDYLKYY